MNRPPPYCVYCHARTDDADFCWGCKSYVCFECETCAPSLAHDVTAHRHDRKVPPAPPIAAASSLDA